MKTAFRFAVTASRHLAFLAVLLACSLAVAQPAAPKRKLPKDVVPLHYALDLRPDLEASTLDGTVQIEIEAKSATDRLVVNALQIEFRRVELDGAVGQVALDADAQTATLTFPQSIAAGP